jgi:hypothetical protein
MPLMPALLAALALSGCASSIASNSGYQKSVPRLPSHITSCPSKVEIQGYIKQFEAQVPPEKREAAVRQLIVALRNSELKQSRCLSQAIAYYQKVQAQRKGTR